MTAALGLTPMVSAAAASSAVTTNNTATRNDLDSADIIDSSKTGSVAIYKYDITSAEKDGAYEPGTYQANGESDSGAEAALEDYGVEGVRFSYLRVGDVETHSSSSSGTGTSVELVYEIPSALADILGLSASDAVDMTSKNEANPCSHTGVYHFTSQQISDAMAAILAADNVSAKNALEGYLYDYGTLGSTADQSAADGVVNMTKTDESGYTYADNLEPGLYLFVETEVPENVVDTTNPWIVQLPFTSSDGEQWLYDLTCYPKNQTGAPTLDKSVRNAYSSTAEYDKNGTVNSGVDYISDNASESLVVYNDDTNAQNTADTSKAAYVANRGGYTSDGVTAGAGGAGYSSDFTYGDTTTASEGDVLDYILVSKLPHITSSSTYLSEYTFTDVLSAGITYNKDVKIAFYDNADDASVNNTANAEVIWNLSGGNYSQDYADVSVQDPDTGKVTADGSARMTVSLTEAGLAVLNGADGSNGAANGTVGPDGKYGVGFSDYYMVVYYTATVNSDASVVLGDEGNLNAVNLTWGRTSDSYYDTLEDSDTYVYTYGIDLTKTFSDNKGDFSKVQFKLYNQTDAYYVVAEKDSDGVYYVTGKTTDEAKATALTPNAEDGSLLLNGIEADVYQLTEAATDDGYSLLKDQIVIGITAASRDADASAVVNGMDADMTDSHAAVLLSVKNNKEFLTSLLPQTGGYGLYAITILGVIAVAGGCFLVGRKKKAA